VGCRRAAGLIAELRQAGISSITIPAVQSKQVRASIQTAKFESGRVLFPKSALWLSELQADLLAFPEGVMTISLTRLSKC
jgi:predicted phage terminase large subunit-like protein